MSYIPDTMVFLEKLETRRFSILIETDKLMYTIKIPGKETASYASKDFT